MLKVSHICKTFTGGIIKKTRVDAVKDVSFTIRDGETFGIVGNSGCGKSTLFMNLSGLLRPQSGAVLWQGKPLDYSKRGLLALRQQVAHLQFF